MTDRDARRAVLVTVILALSGCTSATDDPPPAAPSSSSTTSPSTTSPSPAATADAPPQSAISLWQESSTLAPEGFDQEDVVLDATGVGPGEVKLPDLSAYPTVRLALRCSTASTYRLTLVGSEASDGITMGGTDCHDDGDGTSSYLTPRLPASIATQPSVVEVQAGEGVAYALSVLGTRSS